MNQRVSVGISDILTKASKIWGISKILRQTMVLPLSGVSNVRRTGIRPRAG